MEEEDELYSECYECSAPIQDDKQFCSKACFYANKDN